MRLQTLPALRAVDTPAGNIKVVTLKENGPRLPLGMQDPATGELIKHIATRRWTLRTEKALGKMRDENKRENPVRFISMVIAGLCEQLGTLSIADPQKIGTSKTARNDWNLTLASISQMWYGDVLYAWIWLRRSCLGAEVDMDLTCPRCRSSVSIQGDLDTLEIHVAESIEDTFWEYELASPFQVRGHNIEKLVIGPYKWSIVERAANTGELDTGDFKSAMIWASIRQVVGLDDIALTETEIEDMDKVDVEALVAEIDKHNIGPDMSVVVDCGKCKNEFRSSLNWSYDSFFGVSGRSAAKKT